MAESGIYAIVNLVNGKRYVGSAVCFRRRWAEHRRDLKRGGHHCVALMRAWRKYGGDKFEFRVLEECPLELLIEREQATIDFLSPEYNSCQVAGSSLGYRHSESARSRMALAQRLRYGLLSDADKQRQAAHFRDPEIQRKAAAARVGVKYRARSAEHCHKISEAKRGKPNLKQRGKVVSEEAREKIRRARARQKFPEDFGRDRAKLSDEQVREIRCRRAAGEFCGEIGKDFGLKANAISRICLRQRYAWVDPGQSPICFPKKGRGGWKQKLGTQSGQRTGWAHSDEARAKISEAAKCRTTESRTRSSSAAKVAWDRKRETGDVTRAPFSDEHRKKLSDAQKLVWEQLKASGHVPPPKSESHRAALSAARKKMYADGYQQPSRSPEHTEAVRQATLQSWADPEIRERRRAAIKANWAVRKAQGYQHPPLSSEQRAKQRAGIKENWERRKASASE